MFIKVNLTFSRPLIVNLSFQPLLIANHIFHHIPVYSHHYCYSFISTIFEDHYMSSAHAIIAHVTLYFKDFITIFVKFVPPIIIIMQFFATNSHTYNPKLCTPQVLF